jgi:hypothetical protein
LKDNIYNWLQKSIEEADGGIGNNVNHFGLPKAHDGSSFEIENCTSDQLDIIAYCLDYVRQCNTNHSFAPHGMIYHVCHRVVPARSRKHQIC